MRKTRIIVSVVLVVFCLALWAPLALAQDVAPVNINTASVEELASLRHVGEALSQRIVEYREENGRFASPEDITNVPGIGQRVYEINKDRIVVN